MKYVAGVLACAGTMFVFALLSVMLGVHELGIGFMVIQVLFFL